MYICAIFAHSKVVKVVPLCWLQNTRNEVESVNDIRSNILQKIFYSHNENSIANFELPLSDEFEEFEDRLYRGYILKINGK